MSQYDFDELLQKYLAGSCDPAEEKYILAWYQTMITDSVESVPAGEQEAIRQRVWQKLAANTTNRVRKRSRAVPYLLAAAACVALLVAAGVWQYNTRTPPTQTTAERTQLQGSIETRNISPTPQVIKLEDGTTITLKPGSRLSYPEHFGQHDRTVFLKGEALFRVKRNTSKPFIVHTGELITEVLGTSFTIKSYEGAKDIEVAVLTGRVSVYQATDRAIRNRKEVILKPNEQLAYNTSRKQLIPGLVKQPVQVIPVNQPVNFVFDAAPLPDVLARLQAVYGIDIFLESDAMSTCVLNADLSELTLFSQLELICKSMNARYEVRGTSIFIKSQGKGCQ